MVQDVVPLLASSNLNEFSQEERCTLGNGGQLCDVLGLTLHAADLHGRRNEHFSTNREKQQLFVGRCNVGLSTDHHLLHNRVTAQDVVLPRVLLDMLIHPRGLP